MRSRFGRGFSPSRWLRSAEGLRLVADGGNGREWILARGLCAYTTLDGAAVPARKRRAFAEMAVARWAPFQDPQSLVEWVGDRAMVWAWSRSRVLEGAEDGEVFAPPRRIVPESLFRGRPVEHGEELIAMDDGCEGRVWRSNSLVASRWWAETPPLEDWNQFLRGVGLPSVQTMPSPQPPVLMARPWTAVQFRGIGAAVTQQRQLLGLVASGISAAVLMALLVGCIALKVSIWQVDKDIDQRSQSLEKIITARDNAVRDSAAVDAALAMRPPAGQVELLSEVSNLMPGSWKLQEWRMADPRTLEMVAQMGAPDPRAIVAAWEGSGRFIDVTAEVGRERSEVKIRAKIVRKSGRRP